MYSWMEYWSIRNKYFGENKREARKNYDEYMKAMKKKFSFSKAIHEEAKIIEKEKMNSAPTPTSNTLPLGWIAFEGQTYSLGTTEVSPYAYGIKQEGNNPMNYATATVQAGTTETQDQRKYLSQRLEDIYWELLRPLEAKFGLTDDERPLTPKDLKKRLADGMFVIKGIKDAEDDEDDEDDYFYGGWTNMIRWRDPAKKADHDGYVAAMKELQALRQKTLDIIKIDEPKAGLDAIKALEAWTPTGAAN